MAKKKSRKSNQARRPKVIGRVVKQARKPIGATPGLLVYAGSRPEEPTSLQLIRYDQTGADITALTPEEIPERFEAGGKALWLEVSGLHDLEAMQRIADAFGMHPLIMEDVLNPGERAKTEEYDGMLLIVLKDIEFDKESKALVEEQVSIVLGKGFVISFCDRQEGLFKPVLERLLKEQGRMRKRREDYLAYALTDCIVDKYFQQIEVLGEEVDDLEDLVAGDPEPETVQRLHELRRELIVFRKAVWPLREVLGSLCRSDNPLIDPKTTTYFRDVHNHCVQIVDIVESLREVLAGLLDLYLSAVSNRMNETMKVLTIIATIFIPLSFVAGVYGMNFSVMPELQQPWGYPAALLLMLAIALSMVWFFRRRRWI